MRIKANKHFVGKKNPILVYLSLSPCALLHRTPGKSCTRSKGLEGSSKDIADSKSNQLLQPGQSDSMPCYLNPD